MGDRTSVTLTVLKQHQQEAIDLIAGEQGQPIYEDAQDGETVSLTYEEVNYGVIDTLALLAKAGIPYSMEAGSGAGYPACEEHLRYLVDGSIKLIGYTMEWPENVLLECLDAIKGQADPEAAIKAFLRERQEPSWDNQLAYSNVARAANLIQQ